MGKRLDRYEEKVLVDMKGNKHLQGQAVSIPSSCSNLSLSKH